MESAQQLCCLAPSLSPVPTPGLCLFLLSFPRLFHSSSFVPSFNYHNGELNVSPFSPPGTNALTHGHHCPASVSTGLSVTSRLGNACRRRAVGGHRAGGRPVPLTVLLYLLIGFPPSLLVAFLQSSLSLILSKVVFGILQGLGNSRL